MNDSSVLTDIPSVLSRKRIVIGIGEFAISAEPEAVIVTHALGSCVAVCLWDPTARVGGMIHVLLPDSKINPTRAEVQPAAFADTGIPLLFRTAYQYGVEKRRCRVQLIGGASIAGAPQVEQSVGKRNVLAVRQLLWRNGVLIEREVVGGTSARNVTLDLSDGSVQLSGSQLAAAER